MATAAAPSGADITTTTTRTTTTTNTTNYDYDAAEGAFDTTERDVVNQRYGVEQAEHTAFSKHGG